MPAVKPASARIVPEPFARTILPSATLSTPTAVLFAKISILLLCTAAVTPVILALLILEASSATVLPTIVTVEPLIVIVFPCVNLGLATVPAIVACEICQLALPTNTQALLRFL